MASYLEQLATDFIEIGFDTRVQEVESYGDLHALMGATYRIGRIDVRQDEYVPVTDVGQRVMRLCQSGLEFRRIDDICCTDAEPRLLSAVSPHIVADPEAVSPVLITHEGEVCGVVKWQGERTCYGLRDVPELNMVAGAFHSLPEDSPLQLNPYFANHAFRIDGGQIGEFQPIRMSALAVPVQERTELVTSDLPEPAVRVLTTDEGLPVVYSRMAFANAVEL